MGSARPGAPLRDSSTLATPTSKVRSRARAALAIECGAVFIGVPLLLRGGAIPLRPIPALLLVAAGAFLVLRAEGFDVRARVRLTAAKPYLAAALGRTTLLCAGLALLTALLLPDLLLDFPERDPRLWALVMLAYPLLSVLPQELLFRAFFFQRYQAMFGAGRTMILVSAAAFGLVHVIFGSWISIGLSFLGGLLFASTYSRTGSLFLTTLEHAIYGDVIFTIGLGRYFYVGG